MTIITPDSYHWPEDGCTSEEDARIQRLGVRFGEAISIATQFDLGIIFGRAKAALNDAYRIRSLRGYPTDGAILIQAMEYVASHINISPGQLAAAALDAVTSSPEETEAPLSQMLPDLHHALRHLEGISQDYGIVEQMGQLYPRHYAAYSAAEAAMGRVLDAIDYLDGSANPALSEDNEPGTR